MPMISFSDRLRYALRERRTTQAKLSHITGIDKGALCHYVKGDFKAKQNNVTKLAIALNVNEAWLMGYNVPMERPNKEDEQKQSLKSELIDIINNLNDEDLQKLRTLVYTFFAKNE